MRSTRRKGRVAEAGKAGRWVEYLRLSRVRVVALGHLTSYVANSERVDVSEVVGSAGG